MRKRVKCLCLLLHKYYNLSCRSLKTRKKRLIRGGLDRKKKSDVLYIDYVCKIGFTLIIIFLFTLMFTCARVYVITVDNYVINRRLEAIEFGEKVTYKVILFSIRNTFIITLIETKQFPVKFLGHNTIIVFREEVIDR